ncbi:sel1 repeat family protein [Corallococcus sp. CA047B]|uniref:SEL1-like repeat protein n=1 Tax=Corallococcus sp. CA047B TaxID=2316729 RepID=UPI000EA08846|nr:SEL1-like repeat protein [Corallococcus sp. CA047B]RKH18469.1 sel1 repeat family protein [Corallococcus sp. CA047B]
MPSSRFLFAWLAAPAFAVLVACAHSSSSEEAAEDPLSTLYLRTCGGTRVEACFNGAERHLKGDGVAKDEARAATLYELGCNGGDPRSCAGLGVLKEEGRGVAKDADGAAKLYAQACERGIGEGCGRLALLYGEGRGVPKSEAQAVRFFQQGCAHDDGLSCNNLGVLMLMGGFGLPQDVAGGMGRLVQACNRQVATACETVAGEFDSGTRTRKDPRLAASYFRQACGMGLQKACERASTAVAATPAPTATPEEGAKLEKIRAMCDAAGTGVGKGMACYLMGVAYEKGASVKENPGRATVFYKHACDQEVQEGCAAMRRMLGLTPEETAQPEPKQSVLESLRLDLPSTPHAEPKPSVLESLRLQGSPPSQGGAEAPKPSVQEPSPFQSGAPGPSASSLDPLVRLDTACRAGRSDACTRRGWLLKNGESGAVANAVQALVDFKRGCVGGDAPGCMGMASLYLFGAPGVPQDEALGQSLLEQTCSRTRGDDACRALAAHLSTSDVGPENQARVMRALERGCFVHESSRACSELLSNASRSQVPAEKEPANLERIKLQACKTRLMSACKELNLMAPSEDPFVRTQRMACETGRNPDACADAATAYAHGALVARDLTSALRWGEQACTGGSGAGCLLLARMHDDKGLGPQDPVRSANFASRACERGSWQGCEMLARALRYGLGVTQDERRSDEAKRRACALMPEKQRSSSCQ